MKEQKKGAIKPGGNITPDSVYQEYNGLQVGRKAKHDNCKQGDLLVRLPFLKDSGIEPQRAIVKKITKYLIEIKLGEEVILHSLTGFNNDTYYHIEGEDLKEYENRRFFMKQGSTETNTLLLLACLTMGILSLLAPVGTLIFNLLMLGSLTSAVLYKKRVEQKA